MANGSQDTTGSLPCPGGCFVSKTHSVEPGTPESGSARDHMEPMEPWPCSFCGLLNFRCDVSCLLSTEDSANLVQLYYTIGKNWKKTCEVVKWCARKTNIPGGPWDLGKLGACDPSQDYKWITVQGLIQNGTVHQPQPILPQSSRTTPNQNPGREYGTRFTSQTYHFFSMFLLT